MSNYPDDCQKVNVINVKVIPCRDVVNFPDVNFMAFPSFTTAKSNGIGIIDCVWKINSACKKKNKTLLITIEIVTWLTILIRIKVAVNHFHFLRPFVWQKRFISNNK